MCGVFGLSKKGSYSRSEFDQDSKTLFQLTEPRGRQAAGLAIHGDSDITFYKAPETASRVLKRSSYKKFIDQSVSKNQQDLTYIGHCRLVTDGSELLSENNQPIKVDSVIGVHNGVINNYPDLKKQENLQAVGSCDTEIFMGLFKNKLESSKSIQQALVESYQKLEGAASVGLLFENYPALAIATNFGSMYYVETQDQCFVFASERKILNDFLKKRGKQGEVHKLEPGFGGILNLETHALQIFKLKEGGSCNPTTRYDTAKKIINRYPHPSHMRYCKRCILPESYPFLSFNEQGVCSQCEKYENQKFKGKEALERFLEPYRSKNGDIDCLVGLSGGRDSSYGLHVLKNEFGMNPIGFCYDWLLTSTKARHNISKMAAALDVEVIYRTGNYEVQSKNIRKNIYGFLKDPDLGMMTFVQAGDKEMYHYGRQVRKEVGVDLTVWCSGYQLEQREFFIGYCGIDKTLRNNPRLYNYGWGTKAYLVAYYGLKSLTNPHYWNRSIFDNALAFWHCFVARDDFLYLFNYYPWSENEVERVLNEVYDWEADTDYGVNQWRMDDFHTCFINYVYYTVGGFSEFDDFRSNQIREGLITRDEAIKLAAQDNKIRYESLLQFSQIVGFNLEHVLKKIEAIPKLYT